MIDYHHYLEEYSHGNTIHGKQNILKFLGYVQTRNIPVKDWKKEFLTHEDVFMGDVKPSTRKTYHSDIRRFINYVVYCENHKEEKKKESFKSRNKIAQITGHTVNTGSRRKRTRIVSHWREL